jgi:hypothetical protein
MLYITSAAQHQKLTNCLGMKLTLSAGPTTVVAVAVSFGFADWAQVTRRTRAGRACRARLRARQYCECSFWLSFVVACAMSRTWCSRRWAARRLGIAQVFRS